MMKVVMYSGGINSWCATKRLVEKYGTGNLILVFADTGNEDPDLYRFLDETVVKFGAVLVRLNQMRDIWTVYRDSGKIDGEMCASELKRDPCHRFLKSFDPSHTTVYVGLDWTEGHRLEKLRQSNPKWTYVAPLDEAPYLSKAEMLDMLRADGIRPPRMYELGFPHNNCGGFCPKAGLAHFRHLFATLPEKYNECELREKALGCSFLKHPAGTPLTLEFYRRWHLETKEYIDDFDWGGCGCFTG